MEPKHKLKKQRSQLEVIKKALNKSKTDPRKNLDVVIEYTRYALIQLTDKQLVWMLTHTADNCLFDSCSLRALFMKYMKLPITDTTYYKDSVGWLLGTDTSRIVELVSSDRLELQLLGGMTLRATMSCDSLVVTTMATRREIEDILESIKCIVQRLTLVYREKELVEPNNETV